MPVGVPSALPARFAKGLFWLPGHIAGNDRPLPGPSPFPYIRYCTPRNVSQPAWKMPHSLNAHGISVGEVKNQNIFMPSPNSQLAKTERRKPLQDRNRALAKIWGSGRVASIESPIYPIRAEYAGYSERNGARTSSPRVRRMNKYSRNCQYLDKVSALRDAVFSGYGRTVSATSTARSRMAAASQIFRHVRRQTELLPLRPWTLVVVDGPEQS